MNLNQTSRLLFTECRKHLPTNMSARTVSCEMCEVTAVLQLIDMVTMQNVDFVSEVYPFPATILSLNTICLYKG